MQNPIVFTKQTQQKQIDLDQDNQLFLAIDQALEFAGDNSTYQKNTRYIVAIYYALISFLLMGMPFLFQSPVFVCIDDKRMAYQCSERVACLPSMQNKSFINKAVTVDSIANTFKLVCNQKSQIGILEMSIFLGTCVGYLIQSNLSEKRGRQQAMQIFIALGTLSSAFAGLVSSKITIFIFFFLIGVSFKGFQNTVYAYLQEISFNKRFIKFTITLLALVGALAQILFNIISYIFPYWQLIIIFFVSIPSFISFFLVRFKIFESPVYYINQKRFAEARLIINEIALINKRQTHNYKLEEEMEDDFNKTNTEKNISNTRSIFDLFHQTSRHKSISIILFVLWFYQAMTYYGVVYQLQYINYDLHQNFLLLTIAEIFSVFMVGPITQKFNEKKQIMYLGLISTVACLVSYCFQIPYVCFSDQKSCFQEGVIVTLAMVIKLTITLYGNSLQLYVYRNYPKDLRKVGQKFCMFGGCIGATLMPMIIIKSRYYSPNLIPQFTFGLFGIVAVICSKYLLAEINEFEDSIFKTAPEDEFEDHSPSGGDHELKQLSNKKPYDYTSSSNQNYTSQQPNQQQNMIPLLQ